MVNSSVKFPLHQIKSCDYLYYFILFNKHGINCILNFRSTVQMLMSLLDDEGARRRKQHRLVRRVYQNKVRSIKVVSL